MCRVCVCCVCRVCLGVVCACRVCVMCVCVSSVCVCRVCVVYVCVVCAHTCVCRVRVHVNLGVEEIVGAQLHSDVGPLGLDLLLVLKNTRRSP